MTLEQVAEYAQHGIATLVIVGGGWLAWFGIRMFIDALKGMQSRHIDAMNDHDARQREERAEWRKASEKQMDVVVQATRDFQDTMKEQHKSVDAAMLRLEEAMRDLDVNTQKQTAVLEQHLKAIGD